MLEEDLALSNIALDLLGQARSLYTYAGNLEGRGRDEDDLAFLRKEHEYHNLLLVERPNTDFAHTVVRQLFYSVFAELLWQDLSHSTNIYLAQIAAKAHKETTYHVRHSAEWLIRLGDGTTQSARRAQQAVKVYAPLVGEMFSHDETVEMLVDSAQINDLTNLRQPWMAVMRPIFDQAKMDIKLLDVEPVRGGRQGKHSEEMGYILAQLQYMQRAYPGCKW